MLLMAPGKMAPGNDDGARCPTCHRHTLASSLGKRVLRHGDAALELEDIDRAATVAARTLRNYGPEDHLSWVEYDEMGEGLVVTFQTCVLWGDVHPGERSADEADEVVTSFVGPLPRLATNEAGAFVHVVRVKTAWFVTVIARLVGGSPKYLVRDDGPHETLLEAEQRGHAVARGWCREHGVEVTRDASE